MNQYLIHRCPECNSDLVEHLKPKEKSKTQKALEFGGSFAEGYFLGTDGSITDWISKKYYDPSKQPKFRCKSCHSVWNKEHLVDETPDDILEREKRECLARLRQKGAKTLFLGLVLAGVAAWSFLYCWNHDFVTTRETEMWLMGKMEVNDYHWSWMGVGIIFLAALSFSVASFRESCDHWKDMKSLKSMDLSTFRCSHYRK